MALIVELIDTYHLIFEFFTHSYSIRFSSFSSSSSCNFMPGSGWSALHEVNPNQKKQGFSRAIFQISN